jgi:tripartite-type tricarboxylate transporter receptor subunit TctC
MTQCKTPGRRCVAFGRWSYKSETRISAIADFVRKGKREKKALPLFPPHATTRASIMRKFGDAACLALVLLCGATAARAEDWPTRPIEWIVPFAPGGTTDVVARLVADKLGQRLGQPVVIINRPGADSEIGYRAAARATPDGYTMVLTVPSVVTNPLYSKTALDPSRLTPVIYLAEGPFILLASAALPAKTMPELIAHMRAAPGKVSCAMSGGVGSIGCSMLRATAKAELLEVPFRGSNPAMLAVMGGQVDLMFSFAIAAQSAAQSDHIRALATTAAQPGPPMPTLPAVAAFLPGFELVGWDGVMVPNGTAPDIVARLNREMNAVLARPDVRAELEKGGLVTVGGTPDAFATRLQAVQASFKRVLAATGVMPQ